MASSPPVSKQRRKGKEFLWVNKDPASAQLSRSDGTEATSILKFVQKNRAPNRRQRPSSKTTHDFIAFETDLGADAAGSSRQQSSGTEIALSENIDLWNAVRSMSTRWRLTVPVNNFATGDTVDPFASTVVPITEPIFGILQYCKVNVTAGASGYRLATIPEEIRPMTDMYQSAMRYLFQHMTQFKHVMYPLLAAYSRLMQAMNRESLSSTQNPDYYLHLALQAVRTSLAEQSNDREAMSHIATGVHLLICAAGLGRHFEESKMHIRAFLKLLPYIDTKSAIGFWELDTVSSLDVMMAVADATGPIIKMSTSDPGSLTPTRATQIRDKLKAMQREERSRSIDPATAIANEVNRYRPRVQPKRYDLLQNPIEDLDLNLGSSLQAILRVGILLPPMSAVLRQILECLTVAKVAWRAPDFATKNDTRWLCQRSRTNLHELLSLAGLKALDISTIEGRVSEALRITLIMVIMAVQYRSVVLLARGRYGSPLVELLTPLVDQDWNELARSVQEAPRTRRQDIEFQAGGDEQVSVDLNELLLWMLLTGHWATGDLPEEGWFAQKAGEVAIQKLGLSGLDLEKVMLKFLYSRTAQFPTLEKVSALMPF